MEPLTPISRRVRVERFSYEGVERQFSASSEVDYTGMKQEVCIPYIPTYSDKKHEKGTYYISLFCEGNLLGQADFEVK